MIFENINNISSKDEFLEKVLIYIRLVEVVAERNSYVLPSDSVINNDVINELISIGILSESNDITKLKIVTKDLYQRLINCVNFYLDHKEAFGGLLDKLSNSKRRDLQIAEQNNNKPTIVDFFAGAGGLSCGFVQAGFKVCFANDFEDVCVRTYRFNHPELPSEKVVKGDIRHIVDNINDYINQDVDVVIGGPPCQGFSSANQQRIIDDPRNELYKYYIKAVSKILPKFVVMENVKGMLTVAEQVVEDYGNINEERNGNTYSYSVAYKLLNSADFAVAQSRERLIYIAIRNDVIQEKGITPQQIFAEIELANNGNNRYLLRDALEAIKSLDAPRIKNMNEVDDEKTGKKIDINKYNGNENGYLRLINNNRIIPILYNHKARYVNEINYDIYRLLDQGDDASDPKIAGIMPYTNRLHCFKDKYYKLIADKPSRTITQMPRPTSSIPAATPQATTACAYGDGITSTARSISEYPTLGAQTGAMAVGVGCPQTISCLSMTHGQ